MLENLDVVGRGFKKGKTSHMLWVGRCKTCIIRMFGNGEVMDKELEIHNKYVDVLKNIEGYTALVKKLYTARTW